MTFRDFDAEARERIAKRRATTFRLRGVDFQVRETVAPEALTQVESLDAAETSERDAIQRLDDAVLSIIIPEHAGQWHDLRQAGQVDVVELVQLVRWLMSEVSDFPTEPPRVSSPGANGQRTAAVSPAGYFSTVPPSPVSTPGGVAPLPTQPS